MKKPDNETIYLIPGSYDGIQTYLWSDDPAPGDEDDPADAIKFIRFDLHEREVKQLQGNHNGLKERMRLLHQRPDMPVERIEAFKLVERLQSELAEAKAQLVAIQDSVVHGKCANSEPCATFCEAIATRKMMKQLRDENTQIRGWWRDAVERTTHIPPFLLELSKSLNETPHCVRALGWHAEKKLQDWIKSLTAKAVSDENN